jgi:antitoxin component of MazEF toxin-antitoxin module
MPASVLMQAKRKPQPRYRLFNLLARITPDNVHPETGWGPSRAKEILGDQGEN